ncbi:hypothetical protein [Maricaulis maris]|uniref:hypothetical protein n=1 Tax=Maricaulis maris TaxID=74318 RepID=UPI003A8EB5BA
MKFELEIDGLRYSGSGADMRIEQEQLAGTESNPLYIHLETGTDWGVAGPSIASVLVVVVVAFLTYKVQRNQIKSNLSNFRHAWMKELRDCATDFVESLFSMAIRIEGDPDFKNSVERIERHERIIALSSRFDMLLSRDDEDVEEISSLSAKIITDLNKLQHEDDSQPILDDMNSLMKLIRRELENAWCDIQKDVGMKK